jgi:hypothetical protein
MNCNDHLIEASRILAGLKKFSMPGDYLAVVDGSMVAGYHLGNALLHRHGVLPDAEHANTPSKLGRPVEMLPVSIQPAYRAFAALEKLRFDFVRSASSYDPRLATEVWAHLEVMQKACDAH